MASMLRPSTFVIATVYLRRGEEEGRTKTGEGMRKKRERKDEDERRNEEGRTKTGEGMRKGERRREKE